MDEIELPSYFIMKEKQDNWREFSYETHRYKDALACLFNVRIVAAVTEIQEGSNKYYLSYNKTVREVTIQQKIDLLKGLLENPNFKKLVAAYSLLNCDFCQKVNNFGTVSGEVSPEITGYQNYLKERLKILKKGEFNIACFNVMYEDVFKEYSSFIENIHKIPDVVLLEGCEIHLRDHLRRPEHDVNKLLRVREDDMPKMEFEILDNKSELHAEINLFECCKQKRQKISYIGVGRLPCMSCHDYIAELHHEQNIVRGTSGLFYTSSIQYKQSNELNKKLKKKMRAGFENEFSPITMERMSRSLSCDELPDVGDD